MLISCKAQLVIAPIFAKELRGAIEANAMTTEDVYAELGELVNGTKKGRENDSELIVVDLTGTGAQDAAIGQVCTSIKKYKVEFCCSSHRQLRFVLPLLTLKHAVLLYHHKVAWNKLSQL